MLTVTHEERASFFEQVLMLILSESRQFPNEDGIGAGRMVRQAFKDLDAREAMVNG